MNIAPWSPKLQMFDILVGSKFLLLVSDSTPLTGDLLKLLTVSSDDKVLPTTYGELRPPLGKHRLKVGAEFVLYKFICSIYVIVWLSARS